jgi:WD40 repeat protein
MPPTLDPTAAWPGRLVQHGLQLTRCRFSPCGRFLFGAGLDNVIQRWEAEREAPPTQLAGHQSWVGAMAFHPLISRLYTGDCHGAIHCWAYDDAQPKPLWTARTESPGWVRALAVSIEGRHLVAAGCHGMVRVLDTADGKLVKELPRHQGHVFSAAFHPAGSALVTGNLFGEVCHSEWPSGKELRRLDAKVLHSRDEDFLADVGGVRSLAFDPKGKLLACSGLRDAESNTFCPGTPAVLVFDWETGKPMPVLEVTGKSDGPVNAVRFLPDGTLVGCGEGQSSGGVWFWNPDQPQPIHSILGATAYDLDLHPDGLRLAVSLYDGKGHTGNGRRAAKREEYMPNAGQVRYFHLHAKA